MQFDIEFYSDDRGEEPVKEFLDEILERNEKLWIRTTSGLEKIKQKAYHKEPLSKSLGKGLWEMRVRSQSNILRIIFTFRKGKTIVLLHGFIKKTQKVPKRELDTAKKILKKLTKKGSI